MKDILKLLLAVLGIPLVLLAQVVGVGTLLYLWGVDGVSLGLAAWTGFKYWFTMMFFGIIFIITVAVTS